MKVFSNCVSVHPRAWKSITYVRRGHVAASKRSNAKLAGRIVSQKDMAVTQFGFVGYFSDFTRLLYIKIYVIRFQIHCTRMQEAWDCLQ